MEAGASGLHAALPNDTSAEKAGKPGTLGTQPAVLLPKKKSWWRQSTSGFPCLPFPVLLGCLGQHRAPIRWFCIPLEQRQLLVVCK